MSRNKIYEHDTYYDILKPYVDWCTKTSYSRVEVRGKENIPTDFGFNHGDYSMPNIIVDKNTNIISFIDLGDSGISSMYFDLYYAIKSLKMNKFDSEINEFLEGYGLLELNEDSIKWMTIVDKAIN